jgi:hypothetical protein
MRGEPLGKLLLNFAKAGLPIEQRQDRELLFGQMRKLPRERVLDHEVPPPGKPLLDRRSGRIRSCKRPVDGSGRKRSLRHRGGWSANDLIVLQVREPMAP